MIKTATLFTSAFLCALLSTLCVADQARGFFVGGSIGQVSSDTYDEDGFIDEINIPSAEILAGYKFNGWLGLDLRYGSGISNSDDDYIDAADDNAKTLKYSVNSYQSFYYRPEIVNKEAKLYFLIGYTSFDATAETTTTIGTTSTTAETDFSESGTSYGLGAGWFVGEDVVVNLEYRQLVDKDSDEFSVVTFGADYRF